MDEIHKLREQTALALVRHWPWTVTPEDRAELARIAEELEALLSREQLPPGLERSWLYRDLGEIEQLRAEICLWRGELAPAGPLFEKAAHWFDAADLPEKAQRCRDRIAELPTWGSRDPDAMLRQAQEALANTEEGTLERCEVLLLISQSHLAAHDLYEAKTWFQKTERQLRRLAPQPPSREELLATVFVLPDGTEPPGTISPYLRLSRIHELYLGVFGGLAGICRTTNHPQEADSYAQALRELRANEPTPAELNELWRQTRATMPRFDPATELPEILRPEGQQALLEELRDLVGDDLVREHLEPISREMLEQQEAWKKTFNAEDPFLKVEISSQNPAYVREDLERLDREDEARPTGAPREDLLERARSLKARAHESGSPPLTAWAQISEAFLLSRSGRDDEAYTLLDQAEATLGDIGDDLKVFLYALRAEIESRKGDWKAVSATCELGIDLVEKLRFRVSVPYMQSAYLKPRLRVYTLGARASHELCRRDEMLDRVDRSKSRAILGYSRLSRIEAAGDPAIEEELAQVCREIDAGMASGKTPSELLERRRLLWDRLFLERIRAHRPAAAADLDLHAVRAVLAPDEAILYYYQLSEHELLIAVLDHEDVWYEIRAISPEQLWMLKLFVSSAQGKDHPKEVKRPYREWMKILAGFLTPPADRLADKRRLLISPHRRLHLIPFQALPWEGDILLRSFAVSYIPNLGSLLLATPSGTGAGVLAVGSCDYEGSGRTNLPVLANAEIEAAEVTDLYRSAGAPALLLSGEEARKERLLELERTGRLSRFACLHVAAHGTNVPSDNPMESKLELRDAPLSAFEIATWRLDADLVVLGACWSGERAIEGRGLAELPGDEMLGLQAAFFAAGARQVLGALWPAGDRLSREILTAFHRHRLAGAPPEEALRTATLDSLDTEGKTNLVRRWAPFYLVSLGRPGPSVA